jgi:hypothetical protein
LTAEIDPHIKLNVVFVLFFTKLFELLALSGFPHKFDRRATHWASGFTELAKAILANSVIAFGQVGILGELFEADTAFDRGHSRIV